MTAKPSKFRATKGPLKMPWFWDQDGKTLKVVTLEAIERINYSSSLLSGQIGTARMAALTPSEMLEIINAKLCESEDDLADWRQRGKVSPGIFHKLVHRFHGLRVMIENNTTK